MFFFKQKKYNEVKIPSAEEMAKRTEKHRMYSIEEIIKKMDESANRGRNYAFFRGYISKKNAKKLRKRHLKVDVSVRANSPYVKISWKKH